MTNWDCVEMRIFNERGHYNFTDDGAYARYKACFLGSYRGDKNGHRKGLEERCAEWAQLRLVRKVGRIARRPNKPFFPKVMRISE